MAAITTRTISRCALLLAALALSGCSSVSNVFSSSSSSPSEIPAGTGAQASGQPLKAEDFDCPSVEIRSGASTLTLTTKGRGDDPNVLDLRYQGSIVKTPRECQLNAGVVTLRVGIEGRIVTGPAGGAGQVDVPIRVAVVQEGANPRTVATKLYRTSAVVASDQGNSTFSIVADDLSFPMPRGNDIDKYVIYVGFDQQAEPARPARKPARRKPR